MFHQTCGSAVTICCCHQHIPLNLGMGGDNLSLSVVAKPDYSAWIAENNPGSASSMEPGEKLSPVTVTDKGP